MKHESTFERGGRANAVVTARRGLAAAALALLACGGQAQGSADASADARICPPSGTPWVIADHQSGPSWVAFDGYFLYWTDPSDVMTANLCGDPTVFAHEAGLTLAIDAKTAFWTRRVDPAHTELRAAPRAGGPAVTLAASPEPDPLSNIAVDDTYAYYGSTAGVVCVPKAGGPTTVLESTTPVQYAVAVDDAYVYFGALQGLMRVPKAGGAPAMVAPATGPTILSIAFDASSVYWTTTAPKNPPIKNDWVVAKVAKAGGSVTTLASDESPISQLVADDLYVYWGSASGPLVRLQISNGTRSVVTTSPSGGVALYGSTIVWTDFAGGRVMGRAP